MPLLLALLVAGLFPACKKSAGSLEALLNTVPADAPYVMTVNAAPVLKQLEFKKDGDKYTFCKEVNDVVNLAGVDKKLLNQICGFIDQTGKSYVMFGSNSDPDEVWFTFGVEDEQEFIKKVEELSKTKFDKKGEYMVLDDHLALRDGQVWACSEKIDIEDIDAMRDLDSDKCFGKKNAELASRMCVDGNVCSMEWNINELLSILRKDGASEEVAVFQAALGLVMDDASYMLSTSMLTEDGMECVTDILNSNFEVAKCTLPLGKIEPAAMAKVNCNAPLLAAVSLPSELVAKFTGLARTLNGGQLGPQEEMLFKMLESIDGTVSASMAGPRDFIVSIPFKTEADAVSAGKLMAASQMNVSTAGNYMVLRGIPTLQGQGSCPDNFKNQFLAYSLNFASVPETIISGVDLSKLGNGFVTLGEFDGGLRLHSKWECRNPMRTLCSYIRIIAEGYITGSIKFPFMEQSDFGASDIEAVDETCYVEELDMVESW